jgi:hypothetical protein
MSSNKSSDIRDIPHKVVFVSKEDMKDVVPDTFDYANKDYIDSHTRFILNEIKNTNLCNGLSEKYIEESLDDALFFIYTIKTTRPQKIEGLVIVKGIVEIDDEIDYLYIDILCGSSNYKRVGSFLLDSVITIGKKLHKKRVVLSALTQSVGFFVKKGFKIREKCDMEVNLKGGRRRTVKYRNDDHPPKGGAFWGSTALPSMIRNGPPKGGALDSILDGTKRGTRKGRALSRRDRKN